MTSMVLILALVVAPPIAEKKRDWKEAKILDVKYEQKQQRMDGDPRSGPSMPTVTYLDTWTFVVELDGTRYELEEQNTKSTFETGQTLRFAIEKKPMVFHG